METIEHFAWLTIDHLTHNQLLDLSVVVCELGRDPYRKPDVRDRCFDVPHDIPLNLKELSPRRERNLSCIPGIGLRRWISRIRGSW